MDVTSIFQFTSVIVSVVSAGAAVVSIIFAWKAVKTAEKSSATSLLTELHKLYISAPVFRAIDTTWTMYREKLRDELQDESEVERQDNHGIPIKEASAKEVVNDLEADFAKRESIHPAFWFWEHLAILVNRGLIDEELALTGFGDPAILGFLSPVDEAWVEKHGMTDEYRGYLKQLHNLWQQRRKS